MKWNLHYTIWVRAKSRNFLSHHHPIVTLKMIIKYQQWIKKRAIPIIIYQGTFLTNKTNKIVIIININKIIQVTIKIKIKNSILIMSRTDNACNRCRDNKTIKTKSNKSNRNHFNCRVLMCEKKIAGWNLTSNSISCAKS